MCSIYSIFHIAISISLVVATKIPTNLGVNCQITSLMCLWMALKIRHPSFHSNCFSQRGHYLVLKWQQRTTIQSCLRPVCYYIKLRISLHYVSLEKYAFTHHSILYNITVTSYWARWRQRYLTSRLFSQQFIQAQIKENIKAPRHWPLCGEFTADRPKDQ